MPHNFGSGRDYRGGNAVYRAMNALDRGYADPRWGDYRQIQEAGTSARTRRVRPSCTSSGGSAARAAPSAATPYSAKRDGRTWNGSGATGPLVRAPPRLQR